MMEIRGETAGDIPAIRHLVRAAFPTPAEAALVDRLRVDGSVVYSLVACEGGEIIGHAMYSRMVSPGRALGLAPVAVHPGCRRRGIAAELIRGGLLCAAADGWTRVFVLGDPAYYNRFGFAATLAEGFSSPYAGPHLMALALGDYDLGEQTGELCYPAGFASLD